MQSTNTTHKRNFRKPTKPSLNTMANPTDEAEKQTHKKIKPINRRVPMFWISRHLDDGTKAYSILSLNGHILGLRCSNTFYVNNIAITLG